MRATARVEAGVVGPGVVVEEAGHEPVGAQGGEVGERLGLVDAPVALADAPAAGGVVEATGRWRRCGPLPC